jgi:branched-chain amino acid transport system ATP-binding protein
MNVAPVPHLEITDAHCGYGRLQVVKGISLTLAQGESLALLGPNGHGKTTLLRAITGLGRLTQGRVTMRGRDITGVKTTAIVELGLTHVPQGNALFPELTVNESLLLAGRLRRARAQRDTNLAMAFDLFPRLRERRHQRVGSMSGGERQMLSIAMGLMSNPEVLILDEPTLGLAPKVRQEMLATLLEIRRTGRGLLVADGDIDFLFSLTDRWQVIELGRTVATGSTADRPSQEQMMEMYVGTESGSHQSPHAQSRPGRQ